MGECHFYYDAQKRPAKVKYGDDVYTYVHNLQGDIVGILDSNGALVVEYKYDAWGKPLNTVGSIADTLGKRNPFRYRGYVYDEEIELSYVVSRYFNHAYTRFINSDDEEYIGVNQDIARFNLYLYCGNSPIGRKDIIGRAWETAYDIITWCASALEVVYNPNDPFAWLGFAGDTLDLIPFVTHVGETIRALKTTSRVVDDSDNVIDTYRTLKKANSGFGLEVHHIVEKRFAPQLDYGKYGGRMPSIALTKAEHKEYTNRWRKAAEYGKIHSNKDILRAVIEVYSDNPRLLGAALYTLLGVTDR